MRTVRFGVIGCGVMGREFASAAARWRHLPDMRVRPEIVAICNRTLSPRRIDWFTTHVPQIRQVTDDWRKLLDNPDVEAVYAAVPHNAHREVYCAAIDAGKHLLGEKPFGIDKEANAAILKTAADHPGCFVRCVSQFLFIPAVQRIGRMLEEGAFGRIIEANVGFLHGSDLNPNKPINWKRTATVNGQYGCMGDLGPHVMSLPIRAGWRIRSVRAVLSNIIKERPDGDGGTAACDTWDNATLLCEAADGVSDDVFPLTVRTQRISPGQTNNWYVEILGTRASVRFSTRQINTLEILEYDGGEQSWRYIDMGHEVAYPSITPRIHQFG
ncbi:MAG TPA: Gfo/Idh/MocA family oxidoreductase, partial [Phycisphaerales bacterium]|nr:Gfo/Idh/MocA family oxidoreductase [Phycisphaerales bacterium]